MSLPPEAPGDRIYALFTQAIRLEGAERRAFLDHLDPELRREVESLVASAEPRGSESDPAPWLAKLQALQRTLDEEDLPERIGDYRLVRRLGAGAMGVVFLASDVRTGREVALKVLRSGALDVRALSRFLFEVEALSRLRHPGIVAIHDSGVWQSQGSAHPYYVMERVAGVPLDEWLASGPSLGERLEVFLGIADAIDRAHRSLVLHRDIKPSNVLVDSHGRPKVLDFGVAKDLGRGLDASLTRPGELVGSLETMSPEQASGEDTVDVQSDVYGLSALLYLILTGHLPIVLEGCSHAEAIRRVLEEEPPPPRRLCPSLPRELELIVLQGLAKEKARRYDDVRALRRDVERYRSHEPISAQAPSALYRLRKWIRRHRARAAVFATLGLALVSTLTIWITWQQSQLRQQRARAAQAVVIRQSLDIKSTAEAREASLEALLVASREQPEVLVETAQALLAGADLKLNFSSGVEQRGEHDLEQARRLLEAAIAMAPSDAEVLDWTRELAIAIVKRGDRDHHRGDFVEARQRFLEAHALYDTIRRSSPGDSRAMDDLGWSFERLAHEDGKLGELERMNEAIEQRLELAIEAVRLHPGDLRALASLCFARLTMSRLPESPAGPSWRAEQRRLAFEVARQMIDLAPEDRTALRSFLRASYTNLRQSSTELDDRWIRNVSEESYRIARHLSTLEMEQEDLELVSFALHQIGDVHRMAGELSEAETAFRQALETLFHWEERAPSSTTKVHLKQGHVLMDLANVELALGREREAEEAARRAVPLLKSVLHSSRADVSRRWTAANVLRQAPFGLTDPAATRLLVEGLITQFPTEEAAVRELHLARWKLEDGELEAALALTKRIEASFLGLQQQQELEKLVEECEAALGR